MLSRRALAFASNGSAVSHHRIPGVLRVLFSELSENTALYTQNVAYILIPSQGSFHAGHARQQLHLTRGRGVQTQTDKKQALTITTSNLHITQITISTSNWQSHGVSARWYSIIRNLGLPPSVKKGVGPCVHVDVVAANFLYGRVGFQARVAVQAC